LFGEHRLPLKIGEFDKVAIDEAKMANSGAGQRLELGCSERSATDYQHTGSC
jgi:hypothetical protein